MKLVSNLRDMLLQREQLRQFSQQSPEQRRLVFYAESKADWNYFGPIIEELTGRHGVRVNYLTSDKEDPQLQVNTDLFQGYYIGEGVVRTTFYKTVDCELFVTSLTDLETFHLKRSVNNVTYLYVFHSMASTHALYREAAFDNYDVIFTVGPHHEKEIRAREQKFGLRQKELVPHGYGRLDKLIEEAKHRKPSGKSQKPHILLASSWGESSITNRCAIPLTRLLLDSGFKVTYRPHPMSQWYAKDKLQALQDEFKDAPDFEYETNIRNSSSLFDSDALITEWSGIALEYAFAYGKPVYSIDTPRKVNNPNYKALGLETLEDWIRKDIGAIIPENDLEQVVVEIRKNLKSPNTFAKKAAALRDKWIYNIGKSGKVAADYIVKRLEGDE